MLVDHAALIDVSDDIPQELDAYTEIIYLYRSSALITIDGKNEATSPVLFSSDLHTHYRPNPPEYIWVKYNPTLFN